MLLALLAGLPATALAAPPVVTIVAHRGLGQGAPENSIAALRESLSRGVQVIELDVRLSSDGHAVLLHDAALDRTTDCVGPVNALPLARLMKCRLKGADERIATLAEALDLVRPASSRLLLDFKTAAPLDEAMRLVSQTNSQKHVIFGLRRIRDIARVRARLPGATILAFIPSAADAAGHAAAGANIIRLWSDWIEADPSLVPRTRGAGAAIWAMVGRRLPRRAVEWRSLHARIMRAGVDGIVTNRPDLVAAAP